MMHTGPRFHLRPQSTLWILLFLWVSVLSFSCARMGSPDGGWYDETPPRVIGAKPADQGTNVRSKHVVIDFDEYIKLDNPTENVVISPPQLEAPEIKAEGKRISVKLIDSLKANTTYTIDFSNGISDNNEGNPMGNYTYSFSTGDHIDTLQVAGYVLSADNLEPVKGILVGLYDNLADSAFHKLPMLRVSKTDASGHFCIKGVAPGHYHIFALQDADGDYMFGQKSEQIAFTSQIVEPSFRADVRQDTLWADSLHIAAIKQVNYTHFLPDNICLRAFNEIITNRYLVKSERKEANHFTLFYSYGDTDLPVITGINFPADNAFIIEASEKKDTINYWIKDSALINQDTLICRLQHHITDSTGVLRLQTDTLTLLSKQPYERRLKEAAKKLADWQKEQNKKKRKGQPYDSVMPVENLNVMVTPTGDMDPDQNVHIKTDVPLLPIDTAHIHLYSHPDKDSLWYPAPYELQRLSNMEYLLKAEWRPNTEYSLEADSATFASIYGVVSKAIKQGLKVRSNDEYATLLVTLADVGNEQVVAQLLSDKGEPIKQTVSSSGQVEFFYLKEGKYYLRLFIDRNKNGLWDTGNYDAHQEPEETYYYPEAIDCKAKWDVTLNWDVKAKPLYQQKPADIVKQKAEKNKKIQHRNLERAKKLGIQYIPK